MELQLRLEAGVNVVSAIEPIDGIRSRFQLRSFDLCSEYRSCFRLQCRLILWLLVLTC